MANNNTANVSVGKGAVGGYFFTAATSATLPTDYTTALSGFTNIGFITDEGIEAAKDAEQTDFKDLNGDVIASEASSITRTIDVNFAEMNADSLKEVFGQSNVTSSSGKTTVKHNNTAMPERAIVMELVLRDGRKWRRVIPRAKVTSWESMTVAATDLVAMGVTYTMFPNSLGDYMYDYIQETASVSQ